MADHTPPDRYQRLAEFADLGCGAEEFEGARRFTRPTDTKALDDSTAKRTSRAFATHQSTNQE